VVNIVLHLHQQNTVAPPGGAYEVGAFGIFIGVGYLVTGAIGLGDQLVDMLDTGLVAYASGKFMGKVIYHNNKNHDLIEEDEFYTNKEWSYKTIFNYDKNHNKIDEIRYDTKNANGTRKSYGYDDYGNMIMERDTSTEIYIGGNRIFSVDPTNKNYLIFKCKYSNFDSHKNWLRQDMFYKDSIAKTVKRVIEYYP
jgi:hypothetical protein